MMSTGHVLAVRNDSDPGRDLPLCEVDPLSQPRWDEEVLALPGATFFHSSAWARTLHAAYGYRPRYLTAREEGRLTFVLPLMEVQSWLTGRRAVSLPFTDEVPVLGGAHGPPALAPATPGWNPLDSTLRSLAAANRWRYIETRGADHPDAPAWDTFYSHTLDLSPGPEALLAACDSSTRRAVRKAQQGPLQVELSDSLDAVRDFHGLLCRTRQRHGVPPQPFSFFAALQREALAPGNGFVLLARLNGQPVAGAVYLHFGAVATYKYGASDERFQQFRGNNLVMWQAINHFAADRFARLEFGRTDLSNQGLRKFKLGWGTRERTVQYHRLVFPGGSFAPATAPRAAKFVRVFQLLPRPLSRVIGAALYKHAG